MKATGITRAIDKLGRIVLPRELHSTMGLEIGTPLEIYTEGEYIMLKKYNPGCCLCSECTELTNFKGKNICKECREELRK